MILANIVGELHILWFVVGVIVPKNLDGIFEAIRARIIIVSVHITLDHQHQEDCISSPKFLHGHQFLFVDGSLDSSACRRQHESLCPSGLTKTAKASK